MSQRAQLQIDSGLLIYFCEPHRHPHYNRRVAISRRSAVDFQNGLFKSRHRHP